MGGLPCAKAAIDNGLGLVQALRERLAVTERSLGCMGASVTLSATKSPSVYPTEEMEEQFLEATAAARRQIDAALEPVLRMAAKIEKHCAVIGGGG